MGMIERRIMTTLQEHIIETLGVKPDITPTQEIRARVDFLKNLARKTNTKGFVLGISGGQDSALAGKLAQIAVDELNAENNDRIPNLWERFEPVKEYQFYGVLLPYGVQGDGADAVTVAEEFIQADVIPLFNIKDAVDALEREFNASTGFGTLMKDYHKGNVKARARMVAQYAFAGEHNLLVLGTAHASEMFAGFETKHGDAACDATPLFGLNKRQGKQILKALGAPEFVITKTPTADLLDDAPASSDEDAYGVTYDAIDNYLEGRKVSVGDAEQIEKLFLRSEHKRRGPITLNDTWLG